MKTEIIDEFGCIVLIDDSDPIIVVKVGAYDYCLYHRWSNSIRIRASNLTSLSGKLYREHGYNLTVTNVFDDRYGFRGYTAENTVLSTTENKKKINKELLLLL